jgi:hypothetical protein
MKGLADDRTYQVVVTDLCEKKMKKVVMFTPHHCRSLAISGHRTPDLRSNDSQDNAQKSDASMSPFPIR